MRIISLAVRDVQQQAAELKGGNDIIYQPSRHMCESSAGGGVSGLHVKGGVGGVCGRWGTGAVTRQRPAASVHGRTEALSGWVPSH